MMTVHIVFKDDQIEGVFSTNAKADDYRVLTAAKDTLSLCHIEHFEVDKVYHPDVRNYTEELAG